MPGCSARVGLNGGPDWCDTSKPNIGGKCPFPPELLEQMLVYQTATRTSRYNEIAAWPRLEPTAVVVASPARVGSSRPRLLHSPLQVLDVGAVQRVLPRVAEAFFFLSAPMEGLDIAPGQLAAHEQKARVAHRRFLETFGLSAEQVPLLALDLRSGSTPFLCAVCGS